MSQLSNHSIAILFLPCRAFPEFKVNSEFITTHLQRALNLDAKLSSHPIEIECPDAGMIGQVSTCRIHGGRAILNLCIRYSTVFHTPRPRQVSR